MRLTLHLPEVDAFREGFSQFFVFHGIANYLYFSPATKVPKVPFSLYALSPPHKAAYSMPLKFVARIRKQYKFLAGNKFRLLIPALRKLSLAHRKKMENVNSPMFTPMG